METEIHPHARKRMTERGASEDEVIETVKIGEKFPAKFGRTGYRRNFPFGDIWRGRRYDNKQLEVYTVQERNTLIAVTVFVKYF